MSQPDFFNVRADFILDAPAPAVNRLAADIIHGQPTTLPGPDDALLTLSLYRAMHDAQAVDAEIRAEIAADSQMETPRPFIVDTLSATPCEHLEMANAQRVRAERGGRAEWQADPPPPDDPADVTEAQVRAADWDWRAIRSGLQEVFCGFGIVAAVAVGAWLVFRAVTGGGQ